MQMGFYPVAVVYNKTQQTNNTSHKITPRSNETQHTKLHTNKGHTIQN
jgi:hypothetical protein